MSLRVKTFLSIGTTGRNGGALALLNTAFSTREVNHLKGFSPKLLRQNALAQEQRMNKFNDKLHLEIYQTHSLSTGKQL